jgi:hypothetical protein
MEIIEKRPTVKTCCVTNLPFFHFRQVKEELKSRRTSMTDKKDKVEYIINLELSSQISKLQNNTIDNILFSMITIQLSFLQTIFYISMSF